MSAEAVTPRESVFGSCSHCGLVINPGEEVHPTAQPFHVPCPTHGDCYVFCTDAHPEFAAWYERTFHRPLPPQRTLPVYRPSRF